MYTREVNGEVLDFGVSGKLYKDALVMFDRQTESLWTQVDGTVLRGEMKGAQLKTIPLTQTTWSAWKRLHPDTLILKKERAFNSSVYEDYFADPDRIGITGEVKADKRLPGKDMVITLRDDLDALALPVKKLEMNPIHQTTLAGKPILVLWNAGSKTAQVFDRRFNGETLEFYVVGQGRELHVRDKQTGTTWSGLSGKALGTDEEKQLTPVQHMVNFWWAWAAYNPHTRIEP